jgi:perosamine synthetase
MPDRWSPHPRYRLYTCPNSYQMALQLFSRVRDDSILRLEGEASRRLGSSAACFVPMARTGLFFALQELIRPGQEVVLSPLTIIDVVNMVILAGGIPVFADTRPDSCLIDPDQVDRLITHRTGAVLITHLHGESAGAYDFAKICNRRSVPLIEDVAQSLGAAENGRRLGTIGTVGVYSVGFYKNLNAWRGGIVVSQDGDLISRIRHRNARLPETYNRTLLRILIQGLVTDLATWPPFFSLVTYPALRQSLVRGIHMVSSRLDPERNGTRLAAMPAEYLQQMRALQARLALSQMERVDPDTQERISNAALYQQGLAQTDELRTPIWRNGTSNIYTYYPVRYNRRDALLEHAIKRRRDFAAQYLRNCADLPEFSEFFRDCPNARAASRELILLPTYPGYPKSEIAKNIDVINEFLGCSRPPCCHG